MSEIFWEIFIVLLLTLLNGFFAGSEIALISIRKTRVASLAKKGNKRARIIQELHQKPEVIFATVQIGISLITIFASAFAGANISQKLSVILARGHFLFIVRHAYALSFAAVVIVVAFVNLILGELVPKSLGLRYSEKFALISAYPVWWLSKLIYVLVKFVSFSSNLLLKTFKNSPGLKDPRLSEEEIRALLAEGEKSGTIAADERNIIENVFEFSDLAVGKILVPRTKITAFDISAPAVQTIKQAVSAGYSRVPIYQGTMNNIVGILYTKKLLEKIGENLESVNLRDFLVPPYFVPSTMKIIAVLQRLQRKKLHMALVTDEHGEIEGLVTLEDVLEELVGDITDETDEANKQIIDQKNGHYLVLGEISIIDFNKYFNSDLPEDQPYATLSGFILTRLGRFPKEGDEINYGNQTFTVKERSQRTVKTVLVSPLKNPV